MSHADEGKHPAFTAGESFRAAPARRTFGVGPVQLPAAPFHRARRRAGADVAAVAGAVREGAAGVAGRMRSLRGEAEENAPPDRRPDGSLVSPPLPAPIAREPDMAKAGPLDAVRAPFVQFGAAVRERWQDAVREGKLAAKEKEAEIRADYERRVRHDARLHARQHGVLPPPRDEKR